LAGRLNREDIDISELWRIHHPPLNAFALIKNPTKKS